MNIHLKPIPKIKIRKAKFMLLKVYRPRTDKLQWSLFNKLNHLIKITRNILPHEVWESIYTMLGDKTI